MQNAKNFQLVLLNFIKTLNLKGVQPRIDYFESDIDDIVLNALSGGTVNQEYMDGTRDISLPFEIAIKSKINQKANTIAWLISDELSSLDIDLSSTDNSYIFLNLKVDKPAINGKDEQGYYIYTVQLIAKLRILKEKKINGDEERS